MAREFLERSVGSRVPVSVLETLSLLVSELVSNAVLHTDGEVVVGTELDGDRVRVTVRDHDPDSARAVVPQASRSSSEASGRGLMIVSSLAERWGVDVTDDAKVVWVELRVSP
jgi:anti-sigma regulatory factor (Ser/Thr protein kinase)